jgi:RimJ/RimL family protein N-acetyltransferase
LILHWSGGISIGDFVCTKCSIWQPIKKSGIIFTLLLFLQFSMMAISEELILQEGEYSVWRYRGILPEIAEFLSAVSWGTEGAVYEHKDIEEHIKYLNNPTLLVVRDKGKIVGTVVFCNARMRSGSARYNYYYVRYFAASREIRGKGIIKYYASKVMELIRIGETEPTIFIACIEGGNFASYKVVEKAGYELVGTMKTHGFSRFFPRWDDRIEQVLSENARKEVITLLENYYEEHTLVNFNYIFLHDKYFVIREKGEIVAGCQAHRVHWVVNKLAGFSGKLIKNIVPYIPFINRVFNPKRFEFLGFEGIYCKPGYENELMRLFEAVLAREGLHSGMFWLGETSPVSKMIIGYNKLGLLHSFIKRSDAYILASYYDLSENEILEFKSRPLYASSFDLT